MSIYEKLSVFLKNNFFIRFWYTLIPQHYYNLNFLST